MSKYKGYLHGGKKGQKTRAGPPPSLFGVFLCEVFPKGSLILNYAQCIWALPIFFFGGGEEEQLCISIKDESYLCKTKKAFFQRSVQLNCKMCNPKLV